MCRRKQLLQPLSYKGIILCDNCHWPLPIGPPCNKQQFVRWYACLQA